MPLDPTAIRGRRGWNLQGTSEAFGRADRAGRFVVRAEEVDRVELSLGESGSERYTGYLRVGAELAPLPSGSGLDEVTGEFTWAPGAGFVGTYRSRVRELGQRDGDRPPGSTDRPSTKRYGARGTSPRHRRTSFAAGRSRSRSLSTGWAADLDSDAGPGIDTIHVWAYPLTGGPPVFLGTPIYGGARPDIGASHGDRFIASGFSLVVQGLPHGNYDLAAFPWSNVTGGFVAPTVVRLTIR